MIIVAVQINNTYSTSIVSRDAFETFANGMIAFFMDSNNIQTRATAKYVDDTHVTIGCSNSGTALIYGVY